LQFLYQWVGDALSLLKEEMQERWRWVVLCENRSSQSLNFCLRKESLENPFSPFIPSIVESHVALIQDGGKIN
jgi:hypothetical protein